MTTHSFDHIAIYYGNKAIDSEITAEEMQEKSEWLTASYHEQLATDHTQQANKYASLSYTGTPWEPWKQR